MQCICGPAARANAYRTGAHGMQLCAAEGLLTAILFLKTSASYLQLCTCEGVPT